MSILETVSQHSIKTIEKYRFYMITERCHIMLSLQRTNVRWFNFNLCCCFPIHKLWIIITTFYEDIFYSALFVWSYRHDCYISFPFLWCNVLLSTHCWFIWCTNVALLKSNKKNNSAQNENSNRLEFGMKR